MSRRIISTPQRSLLDDPFARLQRISDAQAYRDSPTGRAENERLKAEHAAIVAAAPVRQVVEIKRNNWNFTLTLECGHKAGYYKPRETLRCHDCRKEREGCSVCQELKPCGASHAVQPRPAETEEYVCK